VNFELRSLAKANWCKKGALTSMTPYDLYRVCGSRKVIDVTN